MVQNCCVPTCFSSARKKSGVSFFTLPVNTIQRQRWLENIKITLKRDQKFQHFRVCSRHFTESDYIFGGNVKRLKKVAVPTINLDEPEIYKQQHKELQQQMIEGYSLLPTSNMEQNAEEVKTIKEETFDEEETDFAEEIKQEPLDIADEGYQNPNFIQDMVTNASHYVKEETDVPITLKTNLAETTINHPVSEVASRQFNNKIGEKRKLIVVSRKKLTRFQEHLDNSISKKLILDNNACPTTNLVNEISSSSHIKEEIIDPESFELNIGETATCNHLVPELPSVDAPVLIENMSAHPSSYNHFSLLRTIQSLEEEIQRLSNEKVRLKTFTGAVFSLNKFKRQNKKIRFYTGIQNYTIFMKMFRFILPSGNIDDYIDGSTKHYLKELTAEDQFFLTFMKLRRGMTFVLLGDIFNISTENAKKIFFMWLGLLFTKLNSLNMNIPRTSVLKGKHSSVLGSIGYISFYIKEPSPSVKVSQFSPKYKRPQPFKCLIMTNSNGDIIYASRLFEGPSPDKQIFEKSTFLNVLKEKLEKREIKYKDVILADEPITVIQLFNITNCELKIPIFQLNEINYEELRNETVTMQRAVQRLKIFKILTSSTHLKPLVKVEEILQVCCGILNFSSANKK